MTGETSPSGLRRAVRPRWVAAWLAVLVVVGAAAFTAGSDEVDRGYWALAPGHSHRVEAPTEPPSPLPVRAPEADDRDRLIGDLLHRRGRAVLDGDRAAFLADVDTGDGDFYFRQSELFDSLQAVPLARWDYEVVGEYDEPVEGRRGDRQTHLAAAVLRFQIEGYDAAPVARPVVYTLVEDGGDWRIADDDEVSDRLPAGAGGEPWDVGAVAVAKGRRSLVIGDADAQEALERLAAQADEAVRRVTAYWGRSWQRRVVIYASSDPDVMASWFDGDTDEAAEFAGLALETYDDVFGWVYPAKTSPLEPTGHRIVLNLDLMPLDDEGMPYLLRHEITHVATAGMDTPTAPTWLMEGVAEFTADPGPVPGRDELPEELADDVSDGRLDALPLSLSFYDPEEADVNYWSSFLVCAWVVQEYGDETLRELYRELGATTAVFDQRRPTDRAFRKVLGVSTDDVLEGVAEAVQDAS